MKQFFTLELLKRILAAGLFIVTLLVFSNTQLLSLPIATYEVVPIHQIVVIDIGGAIKVPGVYKLAAGSRLHDVINLAGGFSESVDVGFINEKLNMAQLLTDGAKYFIPGQIVSSANPTNSSVVNINTASSAQLDSLAGIGKTTAEKIIKARPYKSIQDLVTKKIITLKVFQQISSQISSD